MISAMTGNPPQYFDSEISLINDGGRLKLSICLSVAGSESRSETINPIR